jgi:hypothetical protein
MKLNNIFKKETNKNSESNFQLLDKQQVKKKGYWRDWFYRNF